MNILCIKQESLTEQLCLWEEAELPSIDKPKAISDWFQWQVGIWTGGEITKDSSPLEIRTKICNIEQQMKEASSQGIMRDTVNDYELVHRFADNVYCREIHIPAGHVVVGKIHKKEHINFISKGRVTVITEQGGIEELVAPCTLVSPPGVKRLLVTHEDTIWSVIHSTEETDLEKIEEQEIARSYTEIGWEQPAALLKG